MNKYIKMSKTLIPFVQSPYQNWTDLGRLEGLDKGFYGIIFQKLGTPSEEDRSFITDQKAIEYLDAFPEYPRVDFNEIYKGGGDDALDLLSCFLQFNPYFRIKIDEALEHPFLADVRKKEMEKVTEEKNRFRVWKRNAW